MGTKERLEGAHRSLAGVQGELVLALVRGKLRPGKFEEWAQRLRELADQLEEEHG